MSEVEVIPNDAMERYHSAAECSGWVTTAAMTGPAMAMTARQLVGPAVESRRRTSARTTRRPDPPVGAVSHPWSARVAVLT